MEVAEYVRTEIGLIPHDWQLLRLEDFCNRVGDGIHTTPNYDSSGDYHFINGNNLADGKIVVTEETKRISKREYLIHKRDLGDSTILLSINGTIGNIAFYKDEKIVLGKSAAYLNLNERFDKRLIFQILQNASVKRYFENELTGSTIKNLGLGSIRNTPIALPKTKIEQTAIATALSDTDALITSLEKLIVKKRNIKQGAMQELLKPKKGWELKTIKDIADNRIKWSFIGGPFGSNLKSFDYTSEGIRVIQLQNIGDGNFINDSEIFTSEAKADELLSNNIYPGDIILSKMGDPVARACIIPPIHKRYLMCSDGIRLCVDKGRHNSYFIFVTINSPQFRSMAENASTGSTRKRIGLKELKTLEVSCPSLDEQNRIGCILMDMDNEISQLESKLEKYRQIKSGMMQNLLTGKIRLV